MYKYNLLQGSKTWILTYEIGVVIEFTAFRMTLAEPHEHKYVEFLRNNTVVARIKYDSLDMETIVEILKKEAVTERYDLPLL